MNHRACGCAIVAVSATVAAQPIDAFWLEAEDGEWQQAFRWSTDPIVPYNGNPDPRDTYNIILNAEGEQHDVELTGVLPMIEIDSLTLASTDVRFALRGTDLRLNGGPINVDSGIFQPMFGAIRNAVITESDDGVILFDRQSNQPPTLLEASTIIGTPEFDNTGLLDVIGGLTLDGVWTQSPQHDGQLRFVGDQTVHGGTFEFVTENNNDIYLLLISPLSTLTLSETTTISGGGSGGLRLGTDEDDGDVFNNNTLINQGQILADDPLGRIEIWSDTFINEGLVRIDNGGELTLSWTGDDFGGLELYNVWQNNGAFELIDGRLIIGGDFATADLMTIDRIGGFTSIYGDLDNTGDVLIASNAESPLILDNGCIIGGELVLEAGGLRFRDEATLEGVSVTGDLVVDRNNTFLRIEDSFSQQDGIVLIDPPSSAFVLFDDMDMIDDVEVRCTAGDDSGVGSSPAGDTFVLGPGCRISGGRLSVGSQGVTTVNQGEIIADACGGLVIATTLINEGLVRASQCSDVTIPIQYDVLNFEGDVLTGGTWEAVDGRELEIVGREIDVNDATLLLSGRGASMPSLEQLELNLGSLSLADGADLATLSDLSNEAALSVGSGCVLDVAGMLTLTLSSQMQVTIGSSPAWLQVQGPAALDGALVAAFADGESPSIGDTFVILTGASVEGAFESVELPAPPEGGRVLLRSTATSVSIAYVCASDFNGDGQSNILDFVAFQLAFVAGDLAADCDASGTLDILDFVCFQAIFKAGCP